MSADSDFAQTLALYVHLIDLSIILNSWEDEDKNRHSPIGDGRALVRDGGYDTWRVVVGIE